MAPIGMVLAEVMSPEMGIVSAVVFLVLSITGLALCGQCYRKSGNAYDVNAGAMTGKSAANGTTDTNSQPDTIDPNTPYTSWRDHKTMPKSTLERQKAFTQ